MNLNQKKMVLTVHMFAAATFRAGSSRVLPRVMVSFALAVLAVSVAGAQAQPPAQGHVMSVSTYMRKVGLLYLRNLDDMSRECGDKEGCDRLLDSGGGIFGRTMDALEDEITIDIDEKGRPPGDEPYFELLKLARYAEYSYLQGNYLLLLSMERAASGHASSIELRYKNAEIEQLIKPETFCHGAAYGVAISGVFLESQAEACRQQIAAARLPVSLPASPPESPTSPNTSAVEQPPQEQSKSSAEIACRETQSLGQKFIWEDNRCKPIASQEEGLSRKELEARSWHTERYCRKHHFLWKDGQCHAKK